MPQLTSEPITAEQSQLSRLSVSIRGKLQFMDYLVRAALADAQRYQDETDPGTRIFIRQLVEMHAANLRLESQNMRLVGELAAHSNRWSTRRLTRMPRETCHELIKERHVGSAGMHDFDLINDEVDENHGHVVSAGVRRRPS